MLRAWCLLMDALGRAEFKKQTKEPSESTTWARCPEPIHTVMLIRWATLYISYTLVIKGTFLNKTGTVQQMSSCVLLMSLWSSLLCFSHRKTNHSRHVQWTEIWGQYVLCDEMRWDENHYVVTAMSSGKGKPSWGPQSQVVYYSMSHRGSRLHIAPHGRNNRNRITQAHIICRNLYQQQLKVIYKQREQKTVGTRAKEWNLHGGGLIPVTAGTLELKAFSHSNGCHFFLSFRKRKSYDA